MHFVIVGLLVLAVVWLGVGCWLAFTFDDQEHHEHVDGGTPPE